MIFPQKENRLRGRSLFIAWGEGGRKIFLGEQKGGSVVTENPKEGITENYGKIQGVLLKFAWKWRHGRGGRGIANVIKCYQWSNIQRGDRLNFTLFSPHPPSPAINNDRSQRKRCTLVILSLSFLCFVLVCLVRRCSSLTAPQFGYIYPYMCSSYPISGTVCYLECRHGFQRNGGVNVLQCGNNGKWNQNVSSTLQCKGTSFLWLFRLFETKQKMEQCCFSEIRCLYR